MIAAKAFDPVLGVDIHIIQPPGPVPPVPVPHPFVGMLIDPMDFAPIIGATVMVNGMPRATAGTGGQCIPPHIPIGGVFVKPPANECEVFMGSSTVLADGDPLSFLGMPALSCHDVGMPPPPRAKKKRKPKSLALPTSVVLAVPMGPPVLVGGPPTISMMALGMKAAMAGLGKAFKKLRKLQKASKKLKALSDKVQDAAKKAMNTLGVPPSIQNKVHRAICTVTGHPVDVATGKVFTETVDFALPGAIPFRWERVWYSTSVYHGPLGSGWHHSYDMALCEEADGMAVRLADGRPLALPPLAPGEEYFAAAERLTAGRDRRGCYLRDAALLTYRFEYPAATGQPAPISSIEDRFGNQLRFFYESPTRLTGIVDAAGRQLRLEWNQAGQIAALIARGPTDPAQETVVARYGYQGPLLVSATDANGGTLRYEYDQGLLVRETSRNGTSFDFTYDRPGPDARCIRTCGRAGTFDRQLTYDLAAGRTTVIDSRGATWLYDWNPLGLVTRIVDPRGGARLLEYDDDGRKVTEVHPSGVLSRFGYDDHGRVVLLENVDGLAGTRETRAYDGRGLLVQRNSTLDGDVSLDYDERGALRARTTAEGTTLFATDERGRVTGSHPGDRETARTFHYDELGTLSAVRDGRGRVLWEGRSDLWGRLVREVRGGHAAVYQRDPARRISAAHFSNRGSVQCEYDGDDNAVTQQEAGGTSYRMQYGAVNRIVRLEDGLGHVRAQQYDTEGDLVGAEDAIGCELRIERNAAGDVVGIRRDGRQARVIERTHTGALQAVRSPEATTSYRYAATPDGVVTSITTAADGCEHQVVRKTRPSGLLTELGSDVAALRFGYDERGRKILESCDALELQWEHGDRLTRLITPWGTIQWQLQHDGAIEITDPAGGRYHIAADGTRHFPSGVTERWRYDSRRLTLSYLLRNRASPGLRGSRIRRSPGGDRVLEESTTSPARRFSYDRAGRMTEAVRADEHLTFGYDDAGNLRTLPGLGRADHARDHTLLRAGNRNYTYDASGRRTAELHDGRPAARFTYDAFGNLARYRREDPGLECSYTYDALQRRLTTAGRGTTRRFHWAGPRLLGESRDGWVRLYLYASERDWTPLAFLERDNGGRWRSYAVHCSDTRIPDVVTDHAGELVWQAQYTPLGQAQVAPGAGIEFSFRLPGQYQDPESGLHYNRFRHYDPETARYLQPDPLLVQNSHRLYQYSTAPLDRHDLMGLNQCGQGGRWGQAGETASDRASQQGIAARRRMARERIARGEYDPLQDTLTPDELADFMDSGRLPEDVRWHHTTQTASDPAMADVTESIQPVRHDEHVWGEHGGDTGGTPTAGIRGDTTSPDNPIYDPNDPDVRTQQYDPNAPSDSDFDPAFGEPGMGWDDD